MVFKAEKPILNRYVQIKHWRKNGNGAKGGGRSGSGGFQGIVVQINEDGTETTMGSAQEGSFTSAARKLRILGNIPLHVKFDKKSGRVDF